MFHREQLKLKDNDFNIFYVVKEMELVRVLRTLAVTIILCYAVKEDVEKREVEDKIWLIMLLLGGCFTLFEYSYNFSLRSITPLHAVSAMLGVILALLFAYSDLTGGADAKAFIVLSLIEPPFLSRDLSSLIPSLTIILNSIILSLVTIVYVVMLNIKYYMKHGRIFSYKLPVHKRIILFMVATPTRLALISKKPHAFFILERVKSGKRTIVLSLKASEDTKEVLKSLLESHAYSLSDEVFASPSIPLMVYILLGYLFYIFQGCIIKPSLMGL